MALHSILNSNDSKSRCIEIGMFVGFPIQEKKGREK